jgi:hypothetical protein
MSMAKMSAVISPSLALRTLVQLVQRPAKHNRGRLSSSANQTGTFRPSMVSYSENELNDTRQRLSGPAPPVRAVDVANIGRSTVRLHAQQLLEVDRLALGFESLRALLGGIQQRPRRRRHAPARHHRLAAIRSVAHYRRRVIRPGIGARLPTRLLSAPNSRRMASWLVVME